MIKTFLRVFLSVGLFAALHSLLASRAAKQQAAAWFGTRQRSGFYRLFFIFQSFLSLGLLFTYLARLPDRTLFRVRGLPALLMRLGQLGGLALAFAAAWQVGLARISGLHSLLAWMEGEERVPAEPEAQGPAPLPGSNSLRVAGPFRYSRHPLNLSPLPVFWLTPRMTVKRLAFNLIATLYLVLGSLHEESRLLKAYGPAYREYQRSGVPFYLPF